MAEPALLRLRAVVPVVVTVGWCIGATVFPVTRIGGDPWWGAALGAAAGPAITAGALRSGRRSFVRHDYPLIVTPEGVVPSGPLLWTTQAVDIALIGTLPTLVSIVTGRLAAVLVGVQAGASVLVLPGLLGAASTRRVRAGLSRSLRAAGTRAVTVIWRL